jgi:hypothetical protein
MPLSSELAVAVAVMAAALLHRHAAGTVSVRSAGSAPADTIDPAVREAMAARSGHILSEPGAPAPTRAGAGTDPYVRSGVRTGGWGERSMVRTAGEGGSFLRETRRNRRSTSRDPAT